MQPSWERRTKSEVGKRDAMRKHGLRFHIIRFSKGGRCSFPLPRLHYGTGCENRINTINEDYHIFPGCSFRRYGNKNGETPVNMPLLGGNFGYNSPYGFHDWEFILTESGLLQWDHALAKTTHISGSLVMVTAIIWMTLLLFRKHQGNEIRHNHHSDL